MLLLRFSVANMPGCENEPYHDESYHPVIVMLSATPMTTSTAQDVETTIGVYSEELEANASQETYAQLASQNNGGGLRNLGNERKEQSCLSLCLSNGCRYCVTYDSIFGLVCTCGRRLESEDEEDPRDRELATVPYTSNLNCFTELQSADCAKLKASVDLGAQDVNVPVKEVKCFLVPTPTQR
jgi:hypothetical protein